MDKDIASSELNTYKENVIEEFRLLDDQYHMISGDRTRYELVKSNDEDSRPLHIFQTALKKELKTKSKDTE
jgi:hypothetical protein